MTVFSNNKKSELLLNSSISVNGLGGAVDALIGISFGNSNSSSSLAYYPFLPFLPCNSLEINFVKNVSLLTLQNQALLHFLQIRTTYCSGTGLQPEIVSTQSFNLLAEPVRELKQR